MAKSPSHPEFLDGTVHSQEDAQRWNRELNRGVRDAAARVGTLTGAELRETFAQTRSHPGSDGSSDVDNPSPDGAAAGLRSQIFTLGRPFPGAQAIPAGAFHLEGSWTMVELLKASAEVWRDLADVEPDDGIADGYRAMARDLERYASALESASAGNGPFSKAVDREERSSKWTARGPRKSNSASGGPGVPVKR
jgi:hypothetical protein